MQIQVRCSCGEGSCPEWAIVELQGVVEPQSSFTGGLPGLEIGRLCCSSSQSYTFTVGYHELAGMKMPLKKPLLVMKKKRVSECDEMEVDSKDSSSVELEVVGVIRHRILFKTRPKALITKAPIKKSGKLDAAASASN